VRANIQTLLSRQRAFVSVPQKKSVQKKDGITSIKKEGKKLVIIIYHPN
tara:strand:- start:715 stop:861 length:147 start_codon:yes stop_codon:yes gene_type:complete